MYARTLYIMFAQTYLVLKSMYIPGHNIFAESSGVEVAVNAPRLTKGNVNVDACHLIAHLLEGDFVEAGINIAGGAGLSFAMRYDEPYLCNPFIFAVLAAYTNIGEGNEPSARHTCASVSKIHGTTTTNLCIKVSRKATRVIGNLYNIGAWMPVVDVIAKLNAVAQNVELYKSANDSCCFPSLKFFAGALTNNLHIDSRVTEQNVLITAQVGSGVLCQKLLFGDWRNLAYIAYDVAFFVAHTDIAVQKALNGIVFLFLLFGVCLTIVTGVENACQKQ